MNNTKQMSFVSIAFPVLGIAVFLQSLPGLFGGMASAAAVILGAIVPMMLTGFGLAGMYALLNDGKVAGCLRTAMAAVTLTACFYAAGLLVMHGVKMPCGSDLAVAISGLNLLCPMIYLFEKRVEA